MSADPALAEDHTPLGIQARCEVDGSHLPDLLPEHLGVLGHRDRMQIDDAEVVLVLVLHRDPVLECPHIITNVQVAARLNTTEYSLSNLHEYILTDAPESAGRGLMYPVPLFERGGSMVNTERRYV